MQARISISPHPMAKNSSPAASARKIPSDGLPNTCLAEFRVESLLAQIRFDPAWLGEWPVLRANTLLLVRVADLALSFSCLEDFLP